MDFYKADVFPFDISVILDQIFFFRGAEQSPTSHMATKLERDVKLNYQSINENAPTPLQLT